MKAIKSFFLILMLCMFSTMAFAAHTLPDGTFASSPIGNSPLPAIGLVLLAQVIAHDINKNGWFPGVAECLTAPSKTVQSSGGNYVFDISPVCK